MSNQAADELEGGDRMKRILLNGWLLVLVAGCSQPPVKPDLSPTVKTLDQAIASKAAVAQPDAVSRALLPPIVVEMPRTDGKPVEPRFDLAVNNAAASEVFMAIVSGTRYSMIVHPGIKERVSVNLKDVTVKEALDTMREMYGYEYKVQGTRIMIEPVTIQTRVFRVNYLLSARKGRSEIRVSSGAVSDSVGAQTAGGAVGTTTPQTNSRALESSKIITTSDTDIWADVASAVRTIIGAEGGRNVIVNAQSGIVVVRALPSELRQVEEFLNAMQGVVARQVMLEAKIIEVQLKDQFATGINWAAFGEHLAVGDSLARDASESTGHHLVVHGARRRRQPVAQLPDPLQYRGTRLHAVGSGGTRLRIRAGIPDQQLCGAAEFPGDARGSAGAVQPAHRDAEQPEGGAQGRHRSSSSSPISPTTRPPPAVGVIQNSPIDYTGAVLLRRRARRHAADRRSGADHPARPPLREPRVQQDHRPRPGPAPATSRCRSLPATSARPTPSCAWATATSLRSAG